MKRIHSIVLLASLTLGACGDDDVAADDASIADAGTDVPAETLPDVPTPRDVRSPPDATRIDAGVCDETCAACLHWVDAVERCDETISADELMRERSECYSQPFYEHSDKWTAPFSVAFGVCIEGLECDQLESFDDLCFPEAFASVNNGTLDAALLSECAAGSSAECQRMVMDDPPSDSNPVTDCLAKWAGCEGEFGDNFWSEDHCISLLAQEGLGPMSTECLDLGCELTAPCLEAEGAFTF